MTRLSDLVDEYAILQTAVEDDGSDAFEVALDQLGGAIGEKAEDIATLVEMLELDAEAARKVAAPLRAIETARNNRAQRLKQYLLSNLEAAGIHRVEWQLGSATVHPSTPSLKVIDREAIPAEWRVYPPPAEWHPDARAIIQLWRDGQEVPGTEVVVGKHLRIR